MICDVETLRRLYGIFFLEMPCPLEWLGRLADVIREVGVDEVEVIAYLHAMFRHHLGVATENPAVIASLRPTFTSLRNFDSRVTVVIQATRSERWLQRILQFYQDLQIAPAFLVDANTSPGARSLLSANGAVCIVTGTVLTAESLDVVFHGVDTNWILFTSDHELPTPGLLSFVDRAVQYSTDFVWGFPRVHCRHDEARDEVQYSQFLPFGPLANAALQWRLQARTACKRERRCAPSEAILLDFDWVVRSLPERADRLQDRDEASASSSLAPFWLHESIPEKWHMWARLSDHRFESLARNLRPLSSNEVSTFDFAQTETARPPDLRTATTKQLLDWRDQIVLEAAAHISRNEIAEAQEWLRKLEETTIDAWTLEMTDSHLPRIAEGRRVVASFDPSRRPADDEVVIVYGNYPHMYGNIVVNNPIRRHVADFWSFKHDAVESDRRWDGVDQIFVINVEERQDRLDSILRELASARAPLDRVTKVAAIKPASGDSSELGGHTACLRSHIEALRLAQRGRYEHVLVLEDDFCFTSDIDHHLTDLSTFFERAYPYWVCLVATSKYGAIEPWDDVISRSFQPVTNAAGYLVSREGLERLLPVFETALDRLVATGDAHIHAADRVWAVLQPSGKFLVFRRKFGFQVSSFSDIMRTFSRYLD